MNTHTILIAISLILAILIIITVVLQPSQKTGLMGDVTDLDKREKRGFEKFLYRSTIVLTVLLFGVSIIYGMALSGLM